MNSFRLPGAVSLSFRSLDSPFHGAPPSWNRSFSQLKSCGSSPRLPNSFSRFPRIDALQLGDVMTSSLQRSLSISSALSVKADEHAEASDLLTELRPLTAAQAAQSAALSESTVSAPSTAATSVAPTPLWMQELMQSNSTRHSRASSIVSTRTRFSTLTLDDARADCRSIDIHVGGQYFRISRDGSKITQDLPPPYTEPAPPATSSLGMNSPDPLLSRAPSMSMSIDQRPGSPIWDARGNRGDYDDDDDDVNRSDSDDDDASGHLTAVHQSPVLMHANIHDAAQTGISSPVDGIVTAEMAERTALPRLEPYPSRLVSPPRHRNGVHLPSLVTDSLEGRVAGHKMQTRQLSTSQSAGPVLMHTPGMAMPDSPTFIGRDVSALFPRISRQQQQGTGPEAVGIDSGASGSASPSSLTMESVNDISLHYARLMRRLDREHRKALHEKDKELEQLRVRLNEVDTVYRQELRARDFVIDDLKQRLDHLQERQEERIERARHEVEDLWESRWKQRDFHLMERMRRLEELTSQA